jgi:hypothetical protein
MLSKMMDKMTDAIGRRHFLGKAASVASAVVMAVLGFAKRADAYMRFCCALCTSSLCGNLLSCAGTWCWTCHDKNPYTRTCHIYHCIECYNSSSPTNCFSVCDKNPLCARPCANIICSQTIYQGVCG